MGAKDLHFAELARKYLPENVAECSLSNETDWHTRFKCTYPTWLPPHQISASYEDADPTTKRAAMVHCVSWAWSHHEVQTGELCPWGLS